MLGQTINRDIIRQTAIQKSDAAKENNKVNSFENDIHT